jgi:hypothetical protein
MTAGTPPTQPTPHPLRRVGVYIDGFNLYYGSLKGTPYKWLDPCALACGLMPSDHVTGVHYFTARVKPTPRNPSVHQRQGIYLRALATLPNVHVREGFFLLKTSQQPKVQPLNPVSPKIPNPAIRRVRASASSGVIYRSRASSRTRAWTSPNVGRSPQTRAAA